MANPEQCTRPRAPDSTAITTSSHGYLHSPWSRQVLLSIETFYSQNEWFCMNLTEVLEPSSHGSRSMAKRLPVLFDLCTICHRTKRFAQLLSLLKTMAQN